jgi:hypothetical protein
MEQRASCCTQRRLTRVRESAMRYAHERGVAVLTVLLPSALSLTAVANLFWHQQL